MGEALAKLKYLRMSPFKVRLMGDLIKGRPVQEALALLDHHPRKASRSLRRLLQSAMANAGENHKLDADALLVKNVIVDGGPTLKRWMPRAMGRATPIRKRTCTVTIVVAEKE